jgi:hypothetical protein
MSADRNKAVVRRFFEEAWNHNNLSVADETYSANNTHHLVVLQDPSDLTNREQ